MIPLLSVQLSLCWDEELAEPFQRLLDLVLSPAAAPLRETQEIS